ncbi:MAG TPA: vWA domain-containing protein [Halomonas sp.]|nr:vWA domain-containing protein [Halomonas sp.]
MVFALPAQAQLSELEGSAGHAASETGSLWDLEGAQGHAAEPSETRSRDDGIDCQGEGPCVETATGLALRVLPRPFSHLYTEAREEADAIVQGNMPAFRPLYVFERSGVDPSRPDASEGWYRVGTSEASAEGWMRAEDVFEWRQALLVSYTHPGDEIEGRNPVLMFRGLSDLDALVDDPNRAERAHTLYEQLEAGDAPESLISMEPKRFVDITDQFYMLPILDWEQTRIQGDDVRLLQLAAAVPGARGADTLENPEYAEQSLVGRQAGSGDLEALKVDLVFVIDTTRSMQPFIDMTRDAVASLTRSFDEETGARFRFGLVTYRDSTEAIPELEYVSRNHTQELVDGEAMVTLLEESARATEVGSLDYPEEVYAGVDEALRSAWRDDALRFMILIGDASAHPPGHPQSTTGKTAQDLRRELDDAQVHLLAMHLQDPRAEADHPVADEQFRALARIRGSQEAAIEAVDAFDQEAYQLLVDGVTDDIRQLLVATIGEVADEPAEAVSAAADAPRESVAALWNAALVEYVGKQARPPKDVVAWAMDRDLVNPADRALEVRVLVNREQLNTLAQSLEMVVQGLMRADITQGEFFEALQGVAGQTMKSPEAIGQGATLAETGLLPAFVQSLPYRSDILALNDEMFASMTAQQRADLEYSVLAKLEQYRAINEQVDAWFALNEDDREGARVYPLHIDYLP